MRAGVARRLLEHGRRLVSIVHPLARVSPSADIGAGAFLAEYAVVRTGTVAGAGLLLQSGAVISHHCTLGDFISIGPDAAVAGHVRVGDGAAVGVGACIKPWISIGDRAMAGAGAVVVGDVSDDTTVIGNPARPHEPRGPVDGRQSDWDGNRLW